MDMVVKKKFWSVFDAFGIDCYVCQEVAGKAKSLVYPNFICMRLQYLGDNNNDFTKK